ncbi:hypothetical protein DFP81_11524 [Marinomonas pollencensis]|uniref:Uncharacterized protein n=1 Tax=Marinomonas pollencensis TaxID=491954 RepID=A0A3E0DFH0_9GAMM|nr:hypothetical protein DFP81_11524 [Marinomonas pollencensis]
MTLGQMPSELAYQERPNNQIVYDMKRLAVRAGKTRGFCQDLGVSTSDQFVAAEFVLRCDQNYGNYLPRF